MLSGLGQRAEFHRPVPFIAAPATFRTHAALRVLAMWWLPHAHKTYRQEFRNFW